MINDALEAIDAFVERELGRNALGCAIAITDAEHTLAVRTYGFADLAARTPVSPQHLFQTGSTGKSFAAFIVMEEVEAGRLHLEAPVTDYLPFFSPKTRFAPVTVHDLLTHTAGISTGGEASPEPFGEVFMLRETEIRWAPGTRFWYSNAGYKAIGLILEMVVGQPYPNIVQDRIFEPLGMLSSASAITVDVRSRSAIGYTGLYGDRPWHHSHPWAPAAWSESASADGSLLSTTEDMAAYLRLILNRGNAPSGRIVSDASFDHMSQPFATDPHSQGDSYGFGLNNRERDGRHYLGHSGGTLGFTTGMWTEDGLGIIVLQNSDVGAWWPVPYALAAARAGLDGAAIPALPEPEDPARIADAADYAGRYRGPAREFEIEASDDGRLLLEGVALERIEADDFLVPHPGFDRFPLTFSREEGSVVGAFHGPEVFVNVQHSEYAGGYVGDDQVPAEWRAYPGHYRSHNPWFTHFRVYVREVTLIASFVSADFGGYEYPLAALPDGSFAISGTPESVRFDTVVGEQAQRAVLMGNELWRTFTS